MSLRPGSRFAPIYRSGTRRRSSGVTVFQATGQRPLPELGVVAGRHVGNAVERNRAKRRIRGAALSVELHPNTAYVVVASADVLDATFSDLTDWLKSAVDAGQRARNED